MKELINLLKKTTIKNWIKAVCLFAFCPVVYQFANLLFRLHGGLENAAGASKIFIDDYLPFNKYWIYIYILAFAVWIISFTLFTLLDEKTRKRNIIIMVVSSIICLISFMFYPTTLDRISEGVIDDISGNGFTNFLFRFMVQMDYNQFSINVCPSFHCISTTVCYLGLRKQEMIPKAYRTFSWIMVILVALSICYTKQHYFLDGVTGTLIPIVVSIIVDLICEKKKNISHQG